MSSSFSIFHFTHIDNINNIVKSGIIANSFIDTNNYRNVGDLDIKEKRKRMYLTIRDIIYLILSLFILHHYLLCFILNTEVIKLIKKI